MRVPVRLMVACAFVSLCSVQAGAQQSAFPLAAPAGIDSTARQVAPVGAVNQGHSIHRRAARSGTPRRSS